MGMPVEASSGKQEYLTRCTELKIVPVAMFIAKLECEHVSLRHHGLGPKGAQAVAAALRTNATIISLNLSENYFGGAGIHALAEVAASLLPPSAPLPSPHSTPPARISAASAPSHPPAPTAPPRPPIIRAGAARQPDAHVRQFRRKPARAGGCDRALCASLGENTTLAEISLRSNDLDDRCAARGGAANLHVADQGRLVVQWLRRARRPGVWRRPRE